MFKQKVASMLKNGKKEGVFNFEDETTVAATLTFMMEFLNLDWMRYYPEGQRDAVVKTMNDLILNGLKRRNE